MLILYRRMTCHDHSCRILSSELGYSINVEYAKTIVIKPFDLIAFKGRGGPIGRNPTVKNSENFSERNAKNFV